MRCLYSVTNKIIKEMALSGDADEWRHLGRHLKLKTGSFSFEQVIDPYPYLSSASLISIVLTGDLPMRFSCLDDGAVLLKGSREAFLQLAVPFCIIMYAVFPPYAPKSL